MKLFILILSAFLSSSSIIIANNTPLNQNSTSSHSTDSTSISHKITSFFSPQTQRAFIEKNINHDQSLVLIMLLAFFAGVLSSFTPCIYPLIPITAGIMKSQATRSKKYNFLLCTSYVLGTACAYGILGFLITSSKWLFGKQLLFGQWLASPFFMLCIIAFFLYFAFAMFGFYDIYLPSFLKERRHVNIDGSLLYSFTSGLIAGGVASPCTGPILGALILIAMQLHNPFFSFATFFAFALGMGLLLLIVGCWSTMLDTLPKAGPWMHEIKVIFGFGLLATCIYLISLNKTIASWLHSLLCSLSEQAQPHLYWLLIMFLAISAGMYYLISGWRSRKGTMITSPLSLAQIQSYTKHTKRPKKSLTPYLKMLLGIALIGYALWQIGIIFLQNKEVLHVLYRAWHNLG